MKISTPLLLAVITLLGLALRACLLNIGLTIDDACSANVVEANDLSDMFERIKVYEMSPPLYFLLLKGFVTTLGFNSIVMALPSFICGVLSIPSAYVLGKHLAEPRAQARSAGLFAAFFTAVSPLAIIYSHEARTYALAGLLLTWTIILYWRFLAGSESKSQYPLLFLTSAALVYTHYTGLFYLLILMFTALWAAYKTHSREPLRALPPMLLACATILPWLPILLYHKSVGTPWADPTPIANFLHVFAGNLASMMPLPVVPAYILIIVCLPLALICGLALRAKPTLSLVRSILCDYRILGLLLILVFSCASFGYVTPYMFGYVRYLSPLVPVSSALLALMTVTVSVAQTSSKAQVAIRVLTIVFLIAGLGGAIWEVQKMAGEDRSGLRKLACDIKAGQYGDSIYLTVPDFTGMILTYYLKHECGYTDDTLPVITGFACPESGKRPVKHEEDLAWWQRKDATDVALESLKKEEERKTRQVVEVRDTYKPNSKLMPTRDISDALERRLEQLYRKGPQRFYKGGANSYDVTVFDKKP